jgi:hypothetical protein
MLSLQRVRRECSDPGPYVVVPGGCDSFPLLAEVRRDLSLRKV